MKNILTDFEWRNLALKGYRLYIIRHGQTEANEKGIYIGVPCVLNRNGIREVLEMTLSENEKKSFSASAQIIKEMLSETEM